MFKRIIPCFLLLAIVFSVVVPVHAFASGGLGVGLSTFENAMKAVSDNAALAWQYDENKTYGGCTVAADGNHILRASKGALVAEGECTMCHQGLGQVLDYYYAHGEEPDTYQDYVAQNYPVTMYSSSGDVTWCPIPTSISFPDFSIGTFSIPSGVGETRSFDTFKLDFVSYNSSGVLFAVSITDPDHFSSISIKINYFFASSVKTPYAGIYSCLNYPCTPKYFDSGVRLSFPSNISTSLVVNGFGYITVPFPVFTCDTPDFTYNSYYEPQYRIGSVVFNLASKDGASINNYYPNIQIVNESTNVYTNPSTGEQSTINSWTYDYLTRTYHLTLEDGSLLDIEFGDNSIKVNVNGELTQEYYYTVEKEEEPGPSPSPDPGPVDPTVTPTPDPGTPTPTPEAGPDPDDPDAPDGFFEWLKQWLIEFKEWLGDWLDKLFNKEPGDITIDESDNSVHINDQDDLDYDIYYTDDQGEQRKTSIRDLLHKFDFLRDIYDIGRDLFTVVGADAAAAHAYNTAGTVDITPYLGDLRTIAAADVMPIAGGGAPSLKMDLGAANSHYGFKYGGEIEILDLSWYTPYKATVDNLLSGFLWLFFVWRLFKHAPNIVSGAGMVTDKAEDIRAGKRSRE